MRTDVHQHLWPEELVSLLAARRSAPCLRPSPVGWWLRLPDEPECLVGSEHWDVDRRAELVEDDRLDRALISLSTVLGVEGLPSVEAAPLLDAYHEGVAALPPCFGGWAALSLENPDPEELDVRLRQGFVGASLPAGALGTPAGVERCGPVLERLELRDAPLLVHPGPNPWRTSEPSPGGAPDWWPALTRYVAQMNEAWHAFAAFGRRNHPGLRVLFVMLAGLGPLHAERLAARGGPPTGPDPLAFLDASSYGPRTIDAVVRELGIDQLVYGSDRPVASPLECPIGPAAREAMLVANTERLLARSVVTA